MDYVRDIKTTQVLKQWTLVEWRASSHPTVCEHCGIHFVAGDQVLIVPGYETLDFYHENHFVKGSGE